MLCNRSMALKAWVEEETEGAVGGRIDFAWAMAFQPTVFDFQLPRALLYAHLLNRTSNFINRP